VELRPVIFSGKLDRRITIKTNSETQDSYGGPQDSWVTLVTNLPAMISHKSGNETFEGNRLNYRVDKSFIIRWRTDLKARDRVEYTPDRGVTEVYNIRDIIEIGRRQGLELICDAQVNS